MELNFVKQMFPNKFGGVCFASFYGISFPGFNENVIDVHCIQRYSNANIRLSNDVSHDFF